MTIIIDNNRRQEWRNSELPLLRFVFVCFFVFSGPWQIRPCHLLNLDMLNLQEGTYHEQFILDSMTPSLESY